MRRFLRYIAILCTLAVCAACGATWWAYEAVQEVRPFYREAMAVQPSVLREAGQELTSRAAALVNDARQDEPWQATFTEDQINGWLAFDLPEKHGNLIPRDISDPRVAIDEDQISIGVRYSGGRMETVLSVDVEPYLSEPNVLSLKILGARAGTLPIPVTEVTDRMTHAAERFGIPLSWIQESETPTALINLRLRSQGDGQRLRLDTIDVERGQFRVGGITECEEANTEISSTADADDGPKQEQTNGRRWAEGLIHARASLPKS